MHELTMLFTGRWLNFVNRRGTKQREEPPPRIAAVVEKKAGRISFGS